MTRALPKPPAITPKPRGNPQGPAPTGREGLRSPLAGRPRPESRTKGCSRWADSPAWHQTASCCWAHGLRCTGRCRGCPDFPWTCLGTGWSSNTQLCHPGGCSRVPHPPSREGLCSPLAGRPRPAFRTPGSSLEQNSPQGSSLQATTRLTDSSRASDKARGSQRSHESGVGQSGAPVKWLHSPGGTPGAYSSLSKSLCTALVERSRLAITRREGPGAKVAQLGKLTTDCRRYP